MDSQALQNTASSDLEIVQTAYDWISQGVRPLLATVVGTWGSSPRRPGAMLLIHPDGRFVGSVSGGCIEDELVQQQLKGAFDNDLPKLVKYGVSKQQAQSVGLPCGGTISLLLERLEAASAFAVLRDAMTQGRPITRKLCLKTGEVSLHTNETNASTLSFQFDGHDLLKTFGPQWQLLIVGAGELSKRTALLALTLDYRIYICDPRAEYAANWQVPHTQLLTCDPVQALKTITPNTRTAVIALSHTISLDDAVIAAALQSNAFYVGALGSRKHNQARRERLHAMGLHQEALARFHGPVGLDINSHTPAEIAIAIVAALIQARNKVPRSESTRELSVNQFS